MGLNFAQKNTRKTYLKPAKPTSKIGTFSAFLISVIQKIDLVILNRSCEMNHAKSETQKQHPLKTFLVDLLSARAGIYFNQNPNANKLKGLHRA